MTYVWEWIAGAIMVAIVFMLVRPNSPGAAAVKSVTDALSNIIQVTTGAKDVQTPISDHAGGGTF